MGAALFRGGWLGGAWAGAEAPQFWVVGAWAGTQVERMKRTSALQPRLQRSAGSQGPPHPSPLFT